MRYRFGDFHLDPGDRRLSRGGVPVELNARYLDALALMVREQGRMVSKERFLDEVWRGVPVTDEALTQCVKTLRRQLGDSAGAPRFIETVPKHGYRFIAAVETVEGEARMAEAPVQSAAGFSWRDALLLTAAGTLGGGAAGLAGGLFYGFAAAAHPGIGAVSALLVLVCLTAVLAIVGAAGVSFGIAAAGFAGGRLGWTVAGGAAGGMTVGAVVKLLGLDAFNLMFGQAPGDITGAPEGALLGAAVGFGAWLGRRVAVKHSVRRAAGAAALAGAAGGLLIAGLGGQLMGASLDALARHFPESRLRLDQIGLLLREPGFGPASQMVTAGLEGLLFGGCVVAAMIACAARLGRGR